MMSFLIYISHHDGASKPSHVRRPLRKPPNQVARLETDQGSHHFSAGIKGEKHMFQNSTASFVLFSLTKGTRTNGSVPVPLACLEMKYQSLYVISAI